VTTAPALEIRTERLILRPWTEEDEEGLVELANNWNVARNLSDAFPHPYTRESARQWVASQTATDAAPARHFAIVFEGRAVGSVGLVPKTDIFRCAMELGYWIGEPFWGRGFASEAVRAVVRWAFATYPEVAAIQARHFASNPDSGRVLARCGFQLDGRLRDGAIKQGVLHDVLVYSRTRRDEEHAGQ
jgi:RimJ/RimL family protein N-acetyltransferase